MAGDDNKLKNFFAREGIIEERLCTLESTIDNIIQEIKRLSLKIDD